MMPAQRIILVNASRLLGDMLRVIIYRAEQLRVVKEVGGDEAFPSAIENYEVEWIILALPSDKNIPGWVDQFITEHQSIRFLVVSTGSSKVKLKWLNHEEEVEDLSVNNLIHILEGHPQHVYAQRHPSLELQSG